MDFLDSASPTRFYAELQPGHALMLQNEDLLVRYTGRLLRFFDGAMAPLTQVVVFPSPRVLCWVEDDTVMVKMAVPEPADPADDAHNGYDYPESPEDRFLMVAYHLPTGRVDQWTVARD